MSASDEILSLRTELTSANVYIDQLKRVIKSEREQVTTLNDYILTLHAVVDEMRKELMFYKSTHPKFEEEK